MHVATATTSAHTGIQRMSHGLDSIAFSRSLYGIMRAVRRVTRQSLYCHIWLHSPDYTTSNVGC